MSVVHVDREAGPMEVSYKIERPDGGWKRNFDDAEKQKLLPIAETLAMMDGNAFFTFENWCDSYLPEAHALYESNGGDTGWASECSWLRDLRFIQEDATLKDAYDKLQVLLALKRKENGNT